MEGAYSTPLDDFRPFNSRYRSPRACSCVFHVEGIVDDPDLLNLLAPGAARARPFDARSDGIAPGFEIFPGRLLLRGQEIGQLFLELVMHPLDAGKRTVSLLTLRRPRAEIHDHSKQVFRCLALLFNEQSQLSFLLGYKWNSRIGENPGDLIFQFVQRIPGSELPKSEAGPKGAGENKAIDLHCG